jgi:hypothetical protein
MESTQSVRQRPPSRRYMCSGVVYTTVSAGSAEDCAGGETMADARAPGRERTEPKTPTASGTSDALTITLETVSFTRSARKRPEEFASATRAAGAEHELLTGRGREEAQVRGRRAGRARNRAKCARQRRLALDRELRVHRAALQTFFPPRRASARPRERRGRECGGAAAPHLAAQRARANRRPSQMAQPLAASRARPAVDCERRATARRKGKKLCTWMALTARATRVSNRASDSVCWPSNHAALDLRRGN